MTSIRSFAVLQVILLVAVGMLAGTCAGHNSFLRPDRHLVGLPKLVNPLGGFSVKNSLGDYKDNIVLEVSVINSVLPSQSTEPVKVFFGTTMKIPALLLNAASSVTSIFRIVVDGTHGRDVYEDNPSLTSGVFADVGGVAGSLLVNVVGYCDSKMNALKLQVSQKLPVAGLENPLATKTVCYPRKKV